MAVDRRRYYADEMYVRDRMFGGLVIAEAHSKRVAKWIANAVNVFCPKVRRRLKSAEKSK